MRLQTRFAMQLVRDTTDMNQTPEERAAEIRERRKEAIFQIRFRALARAGKPIAGAYLNNPPTPRVQWTYTKSPRKNCLADNVGSTFST